MNIREISDIFKDTADNITAIKSYNFGWASDRVRQGNTEDFQELNEFPRVFFSVPTITGSDQTRKQDTYQVTIFFDDLLGYNNEGDADLTLQIDKWAALQEYANYFVQRLNKVKQSILPNYLFIPEAPSITFDSFTGLQRMITVQLSFTLVVPTNCEPVVSKLVECIANIVTSSNLTAALKNLIDLTSTLQASSSLSANLQLTKFAASSLNGIASLNASALVSKLPTSSLTGAGTLAAELTVGGAFDADAQAFFDRVTTAGGTLSATEKTAVNTLVVGMKADGIWTKMKAIYPMVGGGQANPAAACAQNLKSASFTGTFTSGWTFASTGVTTGGNVAFMNTFLTPSISLTGNNNSMGFYTGSNLQETHPDPVNMGVFNSGSQLYVITKINSALRTRNYGTVQVEFLTTIMKGFYMTVRKSSTVADLFLNGNLVATGAAGGTPPNIPIYIGGMNLNNTTYSQIQNDYRFVYISDTLTDTEASNFYTAVQAFQTSLNRQVI